MRMRHKPYARPELAAWPYSINDPASFKSSWANHYVNPAAFLRIELGCGKGGFISNISIADPAYNYLGVDIKSDMLVVAKRTIEQRYKLINKSISNILITSWDIEIIDQILSINDNIDRIYINFCNPWHKSGHAKHRLTHPRQLVQYRSILRPYGDIYFKTDDDILFSDSLRYFSLAGFEIVWHTADLHAAEPEWNIRTEHENMFSSRGIPIKACIARMQMDENIDTELLRRIKNP